jgi:Domain of unknown function (DUF4136)
MARWRIALTVALAGTMTLLVACSTLTVTSDVNRSLIGSVRCQTFAFSGSFNVDSPLRATIANPINETRLRDAIRRHLVATGMHELPSPQQAACAVGYGIGSRHVVDAWGGWGWGWGWGWGGWGWGGWGWGGGPGWGGPYVYRQALMVVNLYDAKTGQAVWHATATQSISDDLTGDKAQQSIDEAVDAIFKKYPG